MDKKQKAQQVRGIIGTLIVVFILLVVAGGYGGYKEFIGKIEGAYAMGGLEGMCEIAEGFVLDDICIVEMRGDYQYDMSCSWGKYRYYLPEDKEPGFFYLLTLDLMRCKLE